MLAGAPALPKFRWQPEGLIGGGRPVRGLSDSRGVPPVELEHGSANLSDAIHQNWGCAVAGGAGPAPGGNCLWNEPKEGAARQVSNRILPDPTGSGLMLLDFLRGLNNRDRVRLRGWAEGSCLGTPVFRESYPDYSRLQD